MTRTATNLFTILIALAAAGPVFATDKCGSICDETWGLAGSPYIGTCDVVVQAGCSLTVDAGVEVRFQAGFELRVEGTLDVNGTDPSPATFRSDEATPAAGDWEGIRFMPGSSGSLDQADLLHADRAVSTDGMALTAADVTISESRYGISTEGGSLDADRIHASSITTYAFQIDGTTATLDDITASAGNSAVYALGGSDVTMANVTAESSTYGLYAYRDTSGPTTVTASGCTFTGNNYGVFIQGSTSTSFANPVVQVNASSILNNSNYDFYSQSFDNSDRTIVDARGNWWGTTDTESIAANVYDRRRSSSAPMVDWCGYLDGPGGASARSVHCPDLSVCDESTVWNLTDQPYLLTSDVVVCPTGSLQLDPGIQVLAVPESTRGPEIEAQGQLTVSGTSGMPVSLSADGATPAAGDWQGLDFVAGSSGSVNHAAIFHAVDGVRSDGLNLAVADVTIMDSTNGVYALGGVLDADRIDTSGISTYSFRIDGSSATLDQVSTSGGNSGVYAEGAASVTIDDLSAQSATYGIYAYRDTAGPTTVGVTNSSLTGNNYGMFIQGSTSASFADPQVTVSASSLFGNSNYDYYAQSFSEADTTVLQAGGNWWGSADPGVIAGNIYDRRRSSNAPLVDWCAFLDAPGGAVARDTYCPDLSVCDEAVAWSQTDRPYLLTSDVVVCPTGSLQLDPGVQILAVPLVNNGPQITVLGNLDVSGASENRVTLRSDASTPSAGNWQGLTFAAGSTGSLSEAVISEAQNGVRATGVSLGVSDVQITDSANGIYMTDGSLDADRVETSAVTTYSFRLDGTTATLDQVSTSGGNSGVYAQGAAAVTIDDLTAQSATYGIYAYRDTAGPTTVGVTNSLLTGNSYGVFVQGSTSASFVNPQVTITASSLFGNGTYDYYAQSFNDADRTVLDAAGNWWGTVDTSAIAANVYDHRRSGNAPMVDWCGFLDGEGGTAARTAICPDLAICDEATTWSQTVEPYLLTSDVVVCPTGTLQIDPGVLVLAVAAAQGAEIEAQGTLTVAGTEAAPVLFDSDATVPAAGDWDGLSFVSGSDGSVAWAELSHAKTAISSDDIDLILDDVSVADSDDGVHVTGGSLDAQNMDMGGIGTYGFELDETDATLQDITTRGGNTGVYALGAASVTLRRADLGSATYGLYAYRDTAGPTTVNATESRFVGNSYGVYVQGSTSASFDNPVVRLNASSIYDNSTYDYLAQSFNNADTTLLWATDCWWGTEDEDQIAQAIYDRNESTSSPQVRFKAFGDSCESALGRDLDRDGVGDFEDNCPDDLNGSQLDADGDGMGDACDPQPALAPLAACDGINDTGDGYVDGDGDGWGDPCDFQPTRPDAYPGAPELCDARDNDGDALFGLDEDADQDADLAVLCGDCDDTEPLRFPCACERCDNLLDDNCDNLSDLDDATCSNRAYCVLLAAGPGGPTLTVAKGSCGGANLAGPYDVIRGFTGNLAFSGGSVDLGAAACVAGGLALDRADDVALDANPRCNEGSSFWLARDTGAADFGAASSGEGRDITDPDPVCP
ncbi:hypothetical protein ABI59_17730 [Acidobacteria bacterium Mor1]|nr:hypothetical protein ABI59_17730 [Acidobacteria bacterium Mor1]